jgi:hypothetical protein
MKKAGIVKYGESSTLPSLTLPPAPSLKQIREGEKFHPKLLIL